MHALSLFYTLKSLTGQYNDLNKQRRRRKKKNLLQRVKSALAIIL